MKAFVKSYWKVILFFAIAGLAGGFFTGLYLLDNYPEEIRLQILEQGIDSTMLGVITAAQAAMYGLVLGAAGIALAKKVGLWREMQRFETPSVLEAGIVAVVGGLVMILADVLYFNGYSDVIAASYEAKLSVVFILGALLYGGVLEEVMLRLFMVSLIAALLHWAFERGKEKASGKVIWAANVLSALLFAAGHLPATAAMIGLTPMIVLRCFLLNGGIGLMFGWLYASRGLQYAMLAHAGCHAVSKLVWILFL